MPVPILEERRVGIVGVEVRWNGEEQVNLWSVFNYIEEGDVMSDAENQNEQPGISLRKSIGIYVVFVAMFSIMFKLAMTTTWFPGIIVFISYLVFGFVLNRVVLRGLIEWHPMYNTIENVSSAKLSSFALWPLSYATLFFKLAVNKVL